MKNETQNVIEGNFVDEDRKAATPAVKAKSENALVSFAKRHWRGAVWGATTFLVGYAVGLLGGGKDDVDHAELEFAEEPVDD